MYRCSVVVIDLDNNYHRRRESTRMVKCKSGHSAISRPTHPVPPFPPFWGVLKSQRDQEDVRPAHSPSILSRVGPACGHFTLKGHPCWAGISIPPPPPICAAPLWGWACWAGISIPPFVLPPLCGWDKHPSCALIIGWD